MRAVADRPAEPVQAAVGCVSWTTAYEGEVAKHRLYIDDDENEDRRAKARAAEKDVEERRD